MEWKAKWIAGCGEKQEICPVFQKEISVGKQVQSASLSITALGVYEARMNGERVGKFIMAPGWTVYQKRLQYQTYDVTELLQEHNCLRVTVGKGWYHTNMQGWKNSPAQKELHKAPLGLLAQLEVCYTDGSREVFATDESWSCTEGPVRFAEIYDGEIYDATVEYGLGEAVRVFDGPYDALIAQQGEEVREHERIAARQIFVTPAGETVVDFGQNVTGYVEVTLTAHAGEAVKLSHAEVLDQKGNFYTENYRTAKSLYEYTCTEGTQTYKPGLTFYGFRYIRIDRFPGQPELQNFTAVAVYSDMKRTGYIHTTDPMLNQLADNVIWGQRGNFLDVPTDCPQRDERMGWTGDAQVFIRTAALNYDVEKFFTKWLEDMKADQGEDGCIPHVIPHLMGDAPSSAAWGDAAAICPWELYMAYGNRETLRSQYDMMKKWVSYIGTHTTTQYLWTGGTHYGDWLGLDAPSGSYKGSSNADFIASAFYAYSTELTIRAGEALGEDVSEYKSLYQKIVETFRRTYPEYHTQTECVLAAHFRLAEDPAQAAAQLAQRVRECGGQLQTGFVGTPYLLHVLSDYGYDELAYELLLRKEYPSWLYPVSKGATTIWEHWDGIKEDGSFWSKDMNSYNHYAYGSVMDWVYQKAAGITPAAPGYSTVQIAPVPDDRLTMLEAVLETRHGEIRSRWIQKDGMWQYDITTPVPGRIVIAGEAREVAPGSYRYYSPIQK